MSRYKLAKLVKGCIQKGDFTLSSGKKSKYYVDLRKLTLSPVGISLIGNQLYELLDKGSRYAIGGLETASIPIITSILLNSPEHIKGFYVRKEQKNHGNKELVVGNLSEGDSFIVVDDVVTTGQSISKVMMAAWEEKRNTKCIGVLCVLDREEGAYEFFTERGFPFYPLFKLSTFKFHELFIDALRFMKFEMNKREYLQNAVLQNSELLEELEKLKDEDLEEMYEEA